MKALSFRQLSRVNIINHYHPNYYASGCYKYKMKRIQHSEIYKSFLIILSRLLPKLYM